MSITINNVSKYYDKTCALKDIQLTLEEGKIYGLLGRNGAGKSTLLNLITNRIYPSEGTLTVNEEPIPDNDKALGLLYLMSEGKMYPEGMKVKEALSMTKLFYPGFDHAYALKIAERFKLPLGKRVKALSTGYSSIFKLVIALSVNTPYLLLDEPVLGLDANHRDLFYKILLEKYTSQPCTIVISTHLIEEIAAIVEEIIILEDGQILRKVETQEILSNHYNVSGLAEAVDRYCLGRDVIGTDQIGGLKTAYLAGKPDPTADTNLQFDRIDLQKLFVKITQREGE